MSVADVVLSQASALQLENVTMAAIVLAGGLTASAPMSARVALVSPPHSGAADTRVVFFRSPSGLEHLMVLSDEPADVDPAPDQLARALYIVSGLPVETLAATVGVSRQTYHKWLRGEGVASENARRLGEVYGAVLTIREIVGADDLRAFLETQQAGIRPITLIGSGRPAAAVGLALRAPTPPPTLQVLSEEARVASGLPGWVRPAQPLRWGRPLTDAEIRARAAALRAPDQSAGTADEGDEDDMPAIHIAFGAGAP